MKTHKALFTVSIILIVLPIIGIPYAWKQGIIFLAGIYIASVALALWRQSKQISLPKRSEEQHYYQNHIA